jgi:hypothetical protein
MQQGDSLLAQTLFRRISWPLTAVAVVMAVALTASPALAGGGDPPGPPPFNLLGPEVTIDGDRHAVLSYDLTCTEQAIAEGAHVEIFAGVSQQFGHATISGSTSTVATCAPGTQAIEIVVAGEGHGSHPGWVEVYTELHGCTSTECFQAAGVAEFKARPAR